MSAAVLGDDGVARCPWGSIPGVMQDYHDIEWGVPVVGESALFERMCLEGFQAGLSWSTILNKRENFRRAFHDFDVDRVARLSDDDVERLMQDVSIVRNRAKILATRKNALATIALREDGGLEAFIDGYKPDVTPAPSDTGEMPTRSEESKALSKALLKRGFGFVGPTTMFALMEATGLVNTHLTGCFRRAAGRVDD